MTHSEKVGWWMVSLFFYTIIHQFYMTRKLKTPADFLNMYPFQPLQNVHPFLQLQNIHPSYHPLQNIHPCRSLQIRMKNTCLKNLILANNLHGTGSQNNVTLTSCQENHLHLVVCCLNGPDQHPHLFEG